MGDLPIMSHSNTFVKLMGDLLQNIVIPSIIRWPYSVLSKFCPHIEVILVHTYIHISYLFFSFEHVSQKYKSYYHKQNS